MYKSWASSDWKKKTTTSRRTAVRDAGVSRYHDNLIEGSSETPRTIAAHIVLRDSRGTRGSYYADIR